MNWWKANQRVVLFIVIGFAALAFLVNFFLYEDAIVKAADAHEGFAAWVQSIGSIIALIVAIMVPMRIRRSELDEANAAQAAYRTILVEALQNLRSPTQVLHSLKRGDEGFSIDKDEVNDIAEIIQSMYQEIQEAAAILDELTRIQQINRFGAVRALFAIRRNIEEMLPIFKGEMRWLDRPTTSVLETNISKVNERIARLFSDIDTALNELGVPLIQK